LTISLKTKLISATMILIICVLIASGMVSGKVIKDGVIEATYKKLHYDIFVTREILDRTFPGQWYIKDGEMYKANIKINNNIDIVDRLAILTGDLVTVYQGNKSIITTARNESGERGIGDITDAYVEEQVLQQGKEYIGMVHINEQVYLTGFWPIRDKNGEIIGMWSVGIPMEQLDQMLAEQSKKLLYTGMVALLISILVILMLARHIFRPIDKIISNMEQVEQGYLTANTGMSHRKDEVGKLANKFESMVKKLAHVVGQTKVVAADVKNASSSLTAATNEVLENSRQCLVNVGEVAAANQQQTVNTNEISNAAKTFNLVVEKLSEDIMRMKMATTQVNTDAELGISSMDAMGQQIINISEIVNETSVIIEELGKRSQKITEITDGIKEIAEFTALLSLNAAIEAARAGKHGLGFAVVAEEVRKLTEDTNRSSLEIAELAKYVGNYTEKAGIFMNNTVNETEKGKKIVLETHEKFKRIRGSINNINDDLEKVVSATSEMQTMSNTMVSNLENSSNNSEQVSMASNSAANIMAEQTRVIGLVHEAAENLKGLAVNVEKSVEQFRL